MIKSNPFTKKNNKNNNNSSRKDHNSKNNNSRFSCLNDDIKLLDVGVDITPSPDIKVKIKNKEKDKEINTRFDILKTEEPIENNDRQRQRGSTNNVFRNIRSPILKKEIEVKPFVYKESEFPDIITNAKHIDTVIVSNTIEEPILETNLEATILEANNSYIKAINKAIVVEEVEVEVEDIVVVEPGCVSIVRNYKTGKVEVIYGSKTDEQKRLDGLEKDLNYHMNKTITQMSIRWEERRQKYDDYHGQGAFKEQYGYEVVYGDEYSDGEEDDLASNEYYEYEYGYESE